MRVWFFSFLLLVASSAFSEQILHNRILFGDAYSGEYVMGLYNAKEDAIQIQMCKPSAGSTSGCRSWLPVMKKSELAQYHDPLIKRLELYKKDLFLYQGKDPKNVKAFDAVIQEIKKEKLENWILSPPSDRGLAPRFNSIEVFNSVKEVLKSVLSEPLPQKLPNSNQIAKPAASK